VDPRAILLAALLPAAACSEHRSPPASGAGQLSVRVPGGLQLARSLDTLTVTVDPAALATTTIAVDPGLFLGVETESRVYPLGSARPARSHGTTLVSGSNFGESAEVYRTPADGLPVPGTRYVAEMTLTLFETDVPPGHHWLPRSDRYKALWTRTLRQAEE
jgi:hypothetical protein